ncbi:MAG: indolepyruvate ferredoxin oxidoreductase family protein [Parvularculaceae bacterium]|nr:indolepyruvate ferredoxin oxidoreductase family protein [Parvularculaceae bacterium]
MSASLSIEPKLDPYELDDRYRRTSGRVFLTGTQALVAIMLHQRRLDRAAGLNTAGFVSGYRGSPLGAVDQALWRAKKFLIEDQIEFLPAINEDLAATAVLGTQQVEIEPDRTVDGVFSMWYGKGPGVDRAGDALKHGNAYGSSPHGGVLVVAGDDHGCASSSMSHQSDVAFMSWYMPTLNPASIAEYIDFGLYGFALSRFSGMWAGFKGISETVESAASVALSPAPVFRTPTDFVMPEGGLNFRWPDLPGMQIERRMKFKKEAVRAFVRANPIDRAIYSVKDARYGIITTGKAHLDVMEALALLGVDERRARAIGLDVYKVGVVWPLETLGAERFMAGKEEVLVVEEKRGIIESQLKEYIYDRAVAKPKLILGKHDETNAALISWVDELSPSGLAPIIAARLKKVIPDLDFSAPLARLERLSRVAAAPSGAKRQPYFCSGCPHNTSTNVPEGSKALAGIGCHFMASWMDRETSSLIQMGGEGVNWAAKSRFLKGRPHIFQNLGDGTWYHSGSMAIRQAIAAKANITYKILFNDAVAMTGGQPVDGAISVPLIANQLVAEGVAKLVILSENPDVVTAAGGLPPGIAVRPRDDLDAVQRELREIEGVTVLIYDQACAAEKRRKRKRGDYPDPARRVFINDAVCEGCGDCSTQSNCLSVVPIETELGRKRRIDQSSCNKDYSCLKGFCPSFVTVEGGALRRPRTGADSAALDALLARLPSPPPASMARAYDLLVAGVGGTGVVTIGAIIAMAAHLEGKGASVLDFMGFAQKGGAVLSYVRLAASPETLHQVRIDTGEAAALIASDLVVATDERALRVLQRGVTRAVVNTDILPTADFIRNRSVDFEAARRLKMLREACDETGFAAADAADLARRLLGDTVYSNMMLLGMAWQKGLVPLTYGALTRAIALNGVAIEKNKRAFDLGRAVAIDEAALRRAANLVDTAPAPLTLDALIERRADFLTAYQNGSYATRYRNFVADIVQRSRTADPEGRLARAVAENLYKLMAYKDEYEVARLYASGAFRQKLESEFEGDYRLKFHMAPPLLSRDLDPLGRPKKREFGPWMMAAFGVLHRLKFLRGSPFDFFGRTDERRLERALIEDYRRDMEVAIAALSTDTLDVALDLARLPEEIRGFGPVKLASIKEAATRREALLRRLKAGSAAAAAA